MSKSASQQRPAAAEATRSCGRRPPRRGAEPPTAATRDLLGGNGPRHPPRARGPARAHRRPAPHSGQVTHCPKTGSTLEPKWLRTDDDDVCIDVCRSTPPDGVEGRGHVWAICINLKTCVKLRRHHVARRFSRRRPRRSWHTRCTVVVGSLCSEYACWLHMPYISLDCIPYSR
jgi:hypothetical protein